MMTIEDLYLEFLQSEGICTDTRRVIGNSLFFALKGDNFDGNNFVGDAIRNGCRLAVTDREELRGKSNVCWVPSTLDALQQLAHHHRVKLAPRVLAITGSNGKTTTKELVRAVLSQEFRVLATGGNLNNHIGVPLTLLSIRNEEMAVIEMGANHAGEIGKLCNIAAPDVGLITNVGRAHLEGFGSTEGVLRAKGELFEYLAEHGGKALLNGEDPVLLKRAVETGVETVVIGPRGGLKVSGRILGQNPCLEVELVIGGTGYRVSSRLVGPYNLQNIIFAVGAGLFYGIRTDSILDAIRSYAPDNQRSQLLEGGKNRVIMDAYNANPTSMQEAIKGLLSYASPPSMLILGDMAELGDASMEAHRQLVQWIETLPIDQVLLVGPNFCQVVEPSSPLLVFKERNELETYLDSAGPRGYHILVKGSRIMGLEKITPLLTGE